MLYLIVHICAYSYSILLYKHRGRYIWIRLSKMDDKGGVEVTFMTKLHRYGKVAVVICKTYAMLRYLDNIW